MTETPTWFTVRRATNRSDPSANGQWTVSKRTPHMLSRNRPPGWYAGDFPTREEAIEYGEAKGWTLVNNWAEAEALWEPLRHRAEEKRRVATERRAVSVEVRIGSELRYVTKEMAETLELLLRDHDELGICKAFTGGVVF